MNTAFRIMGILWHTLGWVGLAALVVQLWVISRDPAGPIVAAVGGSLPLMALAIVMIGNGVGLLVGARWSRRLTIILSSILLFWGLASLLLIGWQRWPIQFVILIVSLFAIAGLLVMLSERGKRAFDAYVSRTAKAGKLGES